MREKRNDPRRTAQRPAAAESEFGSETDGGNARLMKSPKMMGLESPELSGESAFGDGDEDVDADQVTLDAPESPGSERMHMAPNVILRRPSGDEGQTG